MVQPYSYGAGKDMSKHLEEKKIFQFLMGLELETYSIMCSNMFSLEPPPSLNKVYAFVAQEER